MLRFTKKKRSRPQIHLTALIDIVFLLLIFFLLASNFIKQQGVVIIVPEIESKTSDELPDLIVKIDGEGNVYVNEVIIDENKLFTVLKIKLKNTSQNTVVIHADRRVQYDKVMHAIDTAKLAGAEYLMLVTKQKPGE